MMSLMVEIPAISSNVFIIDQLMDTWILQDDYRGIAE